MRNKGGFPFRLQASTEVGTTARTAEIKREYYPDCTAEYIRSGAGFLEINGRSFHIRKDAVYLLTPGSSHRYRPDRSDPWYKLFFAVSGPLVQTLLEAYELDQVYHIPDVPELQKYFREMTALNYDNRLAAVVFHRFVEEAARIVRGSDDTVPPSVLALRKTLEDSVETPFVLAQYAAKYPVSETWLIRRFAAAYHATPYEYLMNLRIETARRLLSYSSNSIKEIAGRLAFSDQYYFSNYFKRKTGLSPQIFRKKHLKARE